LLKSGNKSYHKRDLILNGLNIRWEHWIDAYHWDVQNHGISIHRKLTETHLFPSSKERMRNHLAEDCLDEEMLNLLKVIAAVSQEQLWNQDNYHMIYCTHISQWMISL
jgi:hypothetical protein